MRPARPHDAEAIARVHVDSWRAAYPHIYPTETLANLPERKLAEMWRQAATSAGAGLLVLELDGDIAGFVQVGPTRDPDLDPERVGEVQTFYLHPSYWGRGHGWRLWEAALQWLIVREYPEVALWVLDENHRARAFYENAGFRVEPGSRRSMLHAGLEVSESRFRRPVS